MKRRILYISILVTLIIISAVFCISKLLIGEQTTAVDATKTDPLDLECPFVSTAYTGNCLDQVLSGKEKEVNSLVKRISNTVNLKIAEVQEMGEIVPLEYSALLSSLTEYNKDWISYRNKKCDLKNSSIGGTAIVIESRKCWINETDDYISLLNDQVTWIK